MEWNYVQPIKNKRVINEFSLMVDYVFSDEYLDFIEEYNGGRPDKRNFVTAEGNKYTLKTFLSFNKDDMDNVWDIIDWSEDLVQDKREIPFAIDAYDNLICFNCEDNKIIFCDTETAEIEEIAEDFEEFLEKLS
jgi:hypothetical protein